MTDAEIFDLFREALDAVSPGLIDELGELKMDRPLKGLGLDSVAFMELLGFIEEEIERTFPEDRFADLSTLGDIAALIRSE